jgi:hypothetical protein
MSKVLKLTFAIHAVVSVLVGALLLFIPGRFLLWIGWADFAARAGWLGIDPVITRLLGAALIALAWSSFRGWQAAEWPPVATLVEMEVAFTVLGCVGLLRYLVFGRLPATAWLLFAVLALFAIAWIACWLQRRRA